MGTSSQVFWQFPFNVLQSFCFSLGRPDMSQEFGANPNFKQSSDFEAFINSVVAVLAILRSL